MARSPPAAVVVRRLPELLVMGVAVPRPAAKEKIGDEPEIFVSHLETAPGERGRGRRGEEAGGPGLGGSSRPMPPTCDPSMSNSCKAAQSLFGECYF